MSGENWQLDFADRIYSPAEAVRAIRSGDRVYLTGNTSVPRHLLKALVNYAPNLSDVTIYQALSIADPDYVSEEMQGHLRVNSIFNSPNVRAAVSQGRADFTPVLLSEWPKLFQRGTWPLDVALAQVSPPDKDGFCSFGIATGIAKTPVESASMIIAEINEQMLPIPGDTKIHIQRFGRIVPVSYPSDEMRMGSSSPSEEVRQIAVHVADLIPDGATLQIGIGEIPDAVIGELSPKKNLGIHSETFSDSVIPLVESGVVNCARKTLHPGKLVGGFLLGSRDLYRWASDHPMVELHPTEYVNDPFVIAQNVKMAAINSAIEVDLTGQICADSIGTYIYSGVGGQMDFIYGASLAEKGIPIIAMTSTVTLKNGNRVSRISSVLKPGAGVTASRNHVHHVVTEYGAVNLHGKTIRERTKLLISISHPQFREELMHEAKKLNYL